MLIAYFVIALGRISGAALAAHVAAVLMSDGSTAKHPRVESKQSSAVGSYLMAYVLILVLNMCYAVDNLPERLEKTGRLKRSGG
jgi:hypothetical protein